MKSMGIIDALITRAIVKEVNKIINREVKYCVFNSMTINNSIGDTGLLEDTLSLFRAFIYAMISCLIILFIEFIQIKFECKISYVTKKFLSIRELNINRRNDHQIIVGLAKIFPMNHM